MIPHIDAFLDNGYTKEEMKMQGEGRRIMHLPMFRASVTCVRVPVTVRIPSRERGVRASGECRRGAAGHRGLPGVRVIDAPAEKEYPLPLHVAGKDDCEVGRLRLDCALENGLAFWVCGDQLLKGAALNAVQIAELL